MCGVFAYYGSDNAGKVVLDGLKRLEYRGYDSWGIASLDGDEVKIFKRVGAIGDINFNDTGITDSRIAISHTRWATHGGVTEINAHPHLSSDGRFALAQNGIVENYQELKSRLIEKGYKFVSETDTEVIVRLIEDKLKSKDDFIEAVRDAFSDLKGRNTIVIIDSLEQRIIGVRNGSPLVLGVSALGLILASDTLSFSNLTNKIVLVNDFELVEISDGEFRLFDVKNGNLIDRDEVEIEIENSNVDKEGFDHFMLKEIVEQRYTIKEAIQYSDEEFVELIDQIKNSKRVYTIGAGTAGFAAQQIAFYLRKYGQIEAIELKSYEFESYRELFSDKDLIIAISQSGETADTLEAVEFARTKGVKVASIVNMAGSTLSRISDFKFSSRTGPEICVASTKAFTAQIGWGLLLSNILANNGDVVRNDISTLSESLNQYFNDELFTLFKDIVKDLKKREHFFILGKGENHVVALEGALKVKEITYKHFEGFPAGELKHGTIALIDNDTPVFGIISEDENKDDMLSALAEVKARGAKVFGISIDNNEVFDVHIKTISGGIASSIANIIPFHLISYFLGVELGNNPDRPRNLAKSVTVK